MKYLLFLVLISPCISFQNFFQDYIISIASAAYSDDPNQCWSKMYDSYTYSIYRQYTIRCNSLNDTCSAYIAIDYSLGKNSAWVFVVFRGTNNNYQFFENGWNYDEMVPFVAGGKVSKLFFDGFNDIWNSGMKDDLMTLKNKYPLQISHFYFLGHSIGGAMASLAATTFQLIDVHLSPSLYTFGQPRTGDKEFADAFDSFMVDSNRIVHKADIVPHLPPLNESMYYHHDYEMWWNNDMGIQDDLIWCYPYYGEDPNCSNSLNESDYNMEDHKYYFGREIIEYGKNGCPGLETSKLTVNKNKDLKMPKKRSKTYSLKTMKKEKL